MGKTFPNLEAVRIDRAGYYFNERLCKLARLQVGQKLPSKVGPWEFIAGEHEMTSSQVVRKLLDHKPGIDPQQLTYTVRSPLDRRRPLGETKPSLFRRVLVMLAKVADLAVSRQGPGHRTGTRACLPVPPCASIGTRRRDTIIREGGTA